MITKLVIGSTIISFAVGKQYDLGAATLDGLYLINF